MTIGIFLDAGAIPSKAIGILKISILASSSPAKCGSNVKSQFQIQKSEHVKSSGSKRFGPSFDRV
ncbi:MAG: hypothetical protein LH631_11515 [Alkalinema sp. CAN_BIN05]|nr:hypothetical protein [Alkalinema sp. CAN_BIN05]